ncbi:MAG: hypothetical protein WA804_15630 [Terriglobales bacterium]
MPLAILMLALNPEAQSRKVSLAQIQGSLDHYGFMVEIVTA